MANSGPITTILGTAPDTYTHTYIHTYLHLRSKREGAYARTYIQILNIHTLQEFKTIAIHIHTYIHKYIRIVYVLHASYAILIKTTPYIHTYIHTNNYLPLYRASTPSSLIIWVKALPMFKYFSFPPAICNL